MRRFHLIFGIAVLLVFLLTGQYMARYRDHLQGMADLPHMLFRSRHIYILLAGLIHLALGTYLTRQPPGWRAILQVAGSVLISAASCLLVAAFIYEPVQANLDQTPFSRAGVIVIAVGTLVHAIAAVSKRSGYRGSR
jgi:hypothetical protein